MKPHLPTSKLPHQQRTAIRFMIVGGFGTLLQYALYSVLLQVFELVAPDRNLVSLAFTLAYVLEVLVNYLMTAYYTFSSKPNRKNAGGFALGRIINYVVQMGLLHIFAILLARAIPDNELTVNQLAGIGSILLSGIINYFVMKFFFHKKEAELDIVTENQTDHENLQSQYPPHPYS